MKRCDWCGVDLGESTRKNKKYCGADCRKKGFADKAHTGEVRTARFLKSGKISLVVWLSADVGLRPGMKIKISELDDGDI